MISEQIENLQLFLNMDVTPNHTIVSETVV
jgi:hypothetical protein